LATEIDSILEEKDGELAAYDLSVLPHQDPDTWLINCDRNEAEAMLRIDPEQLDGMLHPHLALHHLPEPIATGAAASPGAAAGGVATLPLDTLRALDLDGRLRVGALTTGTLRVARLDARVAAKDGLVKLSPLSARLYEAPTLATSRLTPAGRRRRSASRRRSPG